MSQPIAESERARALDNAVRPYLKRGWLVQSQTATRAQLVKHPGKRSVLVFIVLFLLFALPGILYVIWPRRDKILLLEVDDQGKVKTTKVQ